MNDDEVLPRLELDETFDSRVEALDRARELIRSTFVDGKPSEGRVILHAPDCTTGVGGLCSCIAVMIGPRDNRSSAELVEFADRVQGRN